MSDTTDWPICEYLSDIMIVNMVNGCKIVNYARRQTFLRVEEILSKLVITEADYFSVAFATLVIFDIPMIHCYKGSRSEVTRDVHGLFAAQ